MAFTSHDVPAKLSGFILEVRSRQKGRARLLHTISYDGRAAPRARAQRGVHT